jgi:uncharacterized membrane-anchored protein
MSARWLACLALLSWNAASAQKLEKQPLTPQQLEAQLRYQTGRVTVRNGLATLDLPAGFRYLDARQATIVLQAWGNPPGSRTLGMLLPSGRGVFAREAWAVVITYDEDVLGRRGVLVLNAVAEMDPLEQIKGGAWPRRRGSSRCCSPR